jgi:DNA-binding MarR family transcriptional regulator
MDASGTSVASSLGLSVMRLARRLRQSSAGALSASQYAALVTLSKRGEMTLGELASAEGVAPPSMTRTAAHLELAGLVLRRPDPLDRRVARVTLSPAGAELVEQARSRRELYLAEHLAALDPTEREVLAQAAGLIGRLAGEAQ